MSVFSAFLRFVSVAAVLAGFILSQSTCPGARVSASGKLAERVRRPVALALSQDGKWLYVANRRSGSISVLDIEQRVLVAEHDVGRGLADIALTPDGRYLLAVDELAGELIQVSCDATSLKVTDRVQIGPVPVSVTISPDGSRCYVASLWARQLTIVSRRDAPRVDKTVALPFAPRRQLLLPDENKLVVADSFGGRIAVLDLKLDVLESVRELPGHNIRGLSLSSDRSEIWLTHQTIAGLAQTTRDDIHWGNLLTNAVRVVPVADLRRPSADLLSNSRLLPIGDVGRGAGDPSGIADSGVQVLVALAGVDEVAIRRQETWHRVIVGVRPCAIVVTPDGQLGLVACTFDDTVCIIDLPKQTLRTRVSLGPQTSLSEVDRGEALFHNARLAHDGWFSCHSCHTDGHTNGQLNDNLGDGSFGAPKRVLSLLGVKDTGPWAWNGEVGELDAQIRKSLQTTMHGPRRPEPEVETQVREIASFLRTLEPPPLLAPEKSAVERGRRVFAEQGCALCHSPPAYTNSKAYDVGLRDEVGNQRFNPPSLRAVGHGGPYFHDNRAKSLDEVFIKHRHQLKNDLGAQELADLVVFLKGL